MIAHLHNEYEHKQLFALKQSDNPSLSDIYASLGPACARGLIYNVIIGNQVIIRGGDDLREFIISILPVLSVRYP